MIATPSDTVPDVPKADFDRDGYVVVRGFFSPDEVAWINDTIARHAQRTQGLPTGALMYEDKSRPETLKQIAWIARTNDELRPLQTSRRFVGTAEKLLGDAVVPQELEWFNKPPMPRGRASPTPPHQDGYYFMLEPNEALTFWIALDPVDESNGCLRYVRGSNRKGLRPHTRSNVLGFSQYIPDYGDADRAGEVAIAAQPGDLLIHHSLTIHRADANTSGRHRRSLGIVYYAARAKIDAARREAYAKALNDELVKKGRL
jgi:phytanoyl-CoA hydroxylase